MMRLVISLSVALGDEILFVENEIKRQAMSRPQPEFHDN